MAQTDENDGALVEASLAGSQEAFGRIVERYQSLVCAVAYSATGDLALSEDLAQETFLSAWRSLAGLRDRARLRPWLCTIARNMARGALRRRDPVRRAEPLDAAAEPAAPASAADPRRRAIDAEQEAILWRTLGEIPEIYREPIILFYREDKSVRAVAEAIGVSEDAVKTRLSRGRKMLKEQVAAFVEEALPRTGPTKALTIAILSALPAAAPQAAAAAVAVTAAKGSTAAKAAVTTGALGGAVLGPILGVLGGVFGATMSYKNARSPRERKFVLKMTGLCVAYVLAFFLVFFPTMWNARVFIDISPWFFGFVVASEWILYGAGLVLFIFWANRRQRRIQIEEGTWVEPGEVAKRMAGRYAKRSIGNLSGIFFGSILGSLAWIIVVSIQIGDWFAASLTLAVGLEACLASVVACRRRPEYLWLVVMADLAIIEVLYLTVINLRMETWQAFWTGAGERAVRDVSLLNTINLAIIITFGIGYVVLILKIRKERRTADKESES